MINSIKDLLVCYDPRVYNMADEGGDQELPVPGNLTSKLLSV